MMSNLGAHSPPARAGQGGQQVWTVHSHFSPITNPNYAEMFLANKSIPAGVPLQAYLAGHANENNQPHVTAQATSVSD